MDNKQALIDVRVLTNFLAGSKLTNTERSKILSNTIFFPLQHIPSENVMLGQLSNHILWRKLHLFQPDDGKIIFIQAW